MTTDTGLKNRNLVTSLAPVFTLLFGVLFTIQNAKIFYNSEVQAFREGTMQYVLSFAVVSFIFLGYVIYAKIVEAKFVGLLCSTYIIALFGLAYQYLYLDGTMDADVFILSQDFSRHCIFLLIGTTVAAILSYIVVRNFVELGDFLYYSVVGIIFVLVGIVYLFAGSFNGAKISVPVGGFYIMPGEFIKILVIVLAAYSMGDKKRYAVSAVVNLLCCVFFVMQHDIGTTAILFLCFLHTTWVVWDNKLVSFAIIGAASIGFVLLLFTSDYAQARIFNTFNAMKNTVSVQQKNYLITMVMAGVKGLGLEKASIYTDFGYTENDGSLCGIYCVFGIFGLFVLMAAYANLCTLSVRNKSCRSQDSIILFQGSCYIASHVLFNLLGAADLFPLTGVCAPLISSGGSSIIAFGLMLGMMAGSLHPKIPEPSLQPKIPGHSFT